MAAPTKQTASPSKAPQLEVKKPSKFDLRAKALRENLLRRKAFQRAQADKQASPKPTPEPKQPQEKDAT